MKYTSVGDWKSTKRGLAKPRKASYEVTPLAGGNPRGRDLRHIPGTQWLHSRPRVFLWSPLVGHALFPQQGTAAKRDNAHIQFNVVTHITSRNYLPILKLKFFCDASHINKLSNFSMCIESHFWIYNCQIEVLFRNPSRRVSNSLNT